MTIEATGVRGDTANVQLTVPRSDAGHWTLTPRPSSTPDGTIPSARSWTITPGVPGTRPKEKSRPMTTVSRTFTVSPPPSVVLDYLKDFSHAEAWDPGTEKCTRNGSGPVVVGSTWHNVSKIAGVSTELTYELKELADDHLVFVGTNETATTTDTITVVPHESGSEVTYEAVIEMSGAAKLASPIVKLVFEKIGGDTEDDMVNVLNGLS